MDAHDLRRLSTGLEQEALPATMAGSELIFEDIELGRRIEQWYERFMRLNRAIHAKARRDGKSIQPYKTLDRVNLLLAIVAALSRGSPEDMAHEVIWRQPFPNANHRTTVAAIAEALGINLQAATLSEVVDAYFVRSKELLDGSDTSLTDGEAKEAHALEMRAMVAAVQSLR